MPSRPQRQSSSRRFSLEQLEDRSMMAGIPALSSLPGAAQTLFLDFDGDFLATWNKTDTPNQKYTNVTVGEFNLDNTAGISDNETAAIKKIWQSVADDYAPFNINVTTVSPASFANNVALRVVMAGTTSATMKNSAGRSFNISGNVFIANDKGVAVDTSGYAALNSYTNGEPNTVYVFARYINTWGTTDSEGRTRDLQYVMATTASHEAGHAFGLPHHGNYDIGDNFTTPIMGSNTQGDRSIWSKYTVGTTTIDSVARLRTLLGVRPDDHASFTDSPNFQFSSYSPMRGYSGSVNGIIGMTGDTDMWSITVNGATNYNFSLTTPAFGNLDAKLVLYKATYYASPYGWIYEPIMEVDPGLVSSNPFSGLGASLSVTLQTGVYAIGVRSHGGYGDMGGYTLTVTQPLVVYYDPGFATFYSSQTKTTTTSSDPSSMTLYTASYATMAEKSVAGAGNVVTLQSAVFAPLTMEQERLRTKASKLRAVDDMFAKWE